MKQRLGAPSRSRFLRPSPGHQPEWIPRVVAECSARALHQNFAAIREQIPHQMLMPMIKADAYGHGAEWVARQLEGLDGLYGFGVASLEEGAEVRKALGPRGRAVRIVVCSGAVPWSEEKGHYSERYHLTPVIASDQDWKRFCAEGWPERIRYELKFNTGMNRLGMSFDSVRAVIKDLKDKPSGWHPAGVLTHLAMSEAPDEPLSRLQKERFIAIRSQFAAAFPSTVFHLANSGAIWNHKYWSLRDLSDVARPGLSLYGVPPWPGAPARGTVPVMTLKAQVISLRMLKPGEGIGYSQTFKVPKKAGTPPVRAAILAAGYADGVHRRFSNQGYAWLNGRETRFIGNVSMDLSAVRAFRETQVGDMVELLGPNVEPWSQAKVAGTIPYELMTSVSRRVERSYV